MTYISQVDFTKALVFSLVCESEREEGGGGEEKERRMRVRGERERRVQLWMVSLSTYICLVVIQT